VIRLVLQIIVACAILFVCVAFYPQNTTIRYDCSIAEFHPDYPLQVKEECRKIKRVTV
jgi:hypothetical protein